jgi:hypothetical protein
VTVHPIRGSAILKGYGWELRPRAPGERRGSETGLLLLEFSKGEVWYYFRVPQSLFEGFMVAESKGSFFRKHIQGKYGDKPEADVVGLSDGRR